MPPVAGWHNTGIPPTLSAADVATLLESCDRSTPVGVRDFAIMILVARLGLRSIEVARLELGDVDQHRGQLVIRGKARRRDRLPLPVEVGKAPGRASSRRSASSAVSAAVRDLPRPGAKYPGGAGW